MGDPARRAAVRLPRETRGTPERADPGRGPRLRVPRPGMALARTRPRRHPPATQARAAALHLDRTPRRVRDARDGSRELMSDQDEAARRMAFFQQLAREAA